MAGQVHDQTTIHFGFSCIVPGKQHGICSQFLQPVLQTKSAKLRSLHQVAVQVKHLFYAIYSRLVYLEALQGVSSVGGGDSTRSFTGD